MTTWSDRKRKSSRPFYRQTVLDAAHVVMFLYFASLGRTTLSVTMWVLKVRVYLNPRAGRHGLSSYPDASWEVTA